MSRLSALLIVLALWAAIYLPALGSLEIKGEEGRRILPAVTMLQSGNYIVPQIGSEPYFSKPPLVNWLVAASFRLTGVRNEWTARLPSALCALLVGLAFATVARQTLGENGSLVAALAWLTNFGMIEKGRLIEIEALYVSLTALAFICWFAWFQQGRSQWLTWIVPWMFLGLGWLAKGPVHLVFFYAIVVSVLYRRNELRTLWHPAHFVGLLLMLAIFAAWAVPCLQMMHETNIAHAWSRQFSGRVSGEGFRFRGWIQNVPRGLGYFLPWLLLFLFARRVEYVDETERRTVRGLAWGIITSFLIISLLPGSLPRYTMPLLAPACWLLVMLFCAERLDLPRWLKWARPAGIAPPLRLPLCTAVIVAIAICGYAVGIVPFLQKRQKVKTIAQRIDAVVGQTDTVYAVDPDYQPFLFYLRAPLVYVSRMEEVGSAAKYVLVQPQNAKAIEASRHARVVLQIKDYRERETILYRLE
jgi:4-amino-4-deoxy-L-arabinose transferase-like glycosyltransferase